MLYYAMVRTRLLLCLAPQRRSATRQQRDPPTRSRGIKRNSEPCFKNTLPADCAGLKVRPSLVMIALVAGFTPNSSAANLSTAVKGASSGTFTTLKGSFGSDVRVILKLTFCPEGFLGASAIVSSPC